MEGGKNQGWRWRVGRIKDGDGGEGGEDEYLKEHKEHKERKRTIHRSPFTIDPTSKYAITVETVPQYASIPIQTLCQPNISKM